MKKRWLGLLILFLFFIPYQTDADHSEHQMYFEAHPPQITKPNWTKEDKKRVDELKKVVTDHIKEYNDAVMKRAEKLAKGKGLFVSNNPLDHIPKARYEIFYEGKILGFPGSYFNNTGDLEDAAKELWETYGVAVHLPVEKVRGDGCGLGWKDCSPAPSTIDWPFGVTVEDGKITDYKEKKQDYFRTSEKIYQTNGESILVASQGLFTQPYTENFQDCNVANVKNELKDDLDAPVVKEPLVFEEDKKDWKSFAGDKIGQGLLNTFERMSGEARGMLFDEDCDKSSLSLVGQFTGISRPLNLTNSSTTLLLANVVQQVAFVAAIVVLAFYSIMYTSGYEQMNPVKFAIRLFLCLLAISFLPWLMQDVLNLNNRIVHFFATLNFSFSGNELSGNSSDILMASLANVLDAFMTATTVQNLVYALFVILILLVAVFPLFTIIMWWYIRLLKIFLGAVVGPLLILMLALPQTAGAGLAFIKSYIGTVFEQIFFMLGLSLVAVIVSNIGSISSELRIAFFGQALLIFACIFFLAEIPRFANTFLSLLGGASSENVARKAVGTAKNAKRTISNGVGAVAGGGKSLKNAGLGLAGAAIGWKEGKSGNKSYGLASTAIGQTKSGKKASAKGKAFGEASRHRATERSEKAGLKASTPSKLEAFKQARKKGLSGTQLTSSSTASTRTERKVESQANKPSGLERVGHAVGRGTKIGKDKFERAKSSMKEALSRPKQESKPTPQTQVIRSKQQDSAKKTIKKALKDVLKDKKSPKK